LLPIFSSFPRFSGFVFGFVLNGVFLAPHAEKQPKTRFKKKKGENDQKSFPPKTFLAKSFLIWIFPKNMFMVYGVLNSPC
jgi:hypothetical protein